MGIETLTALILHYKYAFIFISAPFVGPIVTLLSGALVRLGTLELIPVLLVLMLSELAADILWYALGARYGERFGLRYGKHFGITHDRILRVQRAYHRYHDSIILVSKLTAGFGIAPAIFFTAGVSRVPFGRYMLMNGIGQVIWTPVMLAIGYYLGEGYLRVDDAFGKLAYVGTALLVLAALLALGHYAGTKLLDSQKT